MTGYSGAASASWQELITTYPGFTITMMLMGFGIAMGIAFLIRVLYTIQRSEQALNEHDEKWTEITEGRCKKGGVNLRPRTPEPPPPPQLPPKTGGKRCWHD